MSSARSTPRPSRCVEMSRFARRLGYWRKVVAEVVEEFLDCGILKHGFARVRCDSCKHEFLLARRRLKCLCQSTHPRLRRRGWPRSS